jgi:hypothetical protein
MSGSGTRLPDTSKLGLAFLNASYFIDIIFEQKGRRAGGSGSLA